MEVRFWKCTTLRLRSSWCRSWKTVRKGPLRHQDDDSSWKLTDLHQSRRWSLGLWFQTVVQARVGVSCSNWRFPYRGKALHGQVGRLKWWGSANLQRKGIEYRKGPVRLHLEFCLRSLLRWYAVQVRESWIRQLAAKNYWRYRRANNPRNRSKQFQGTWKS